MADKVGGYSITYHAAFYMNNDKKVVFDRVVEQTKKIIEVVEKENLQVWIRPETTGKGTQWGDLDEIINLQKSSSRFCLVLIFRICMPVQEAE